jgi:hypothetical protein
VNVENAQNVDRLYVQAHQPFYHVGGWEIGEYEGFDSEAGAEIRINGGPWVEVRDENVTCALGDESTGCVAGAHSTIRFSIPVSSSGDVMEGMNTIDFRFNGTEGVRSGYRVLGVGFMYPDHTVEDFNPMIDGAIPAGSFVKDDYTQWVAPSNSDPVHGREMWTKRNTLLTLKSEEVMIASCADCHANDGRDLKYFNFSNEVIIARSKSHGFSDQEARDVAAYIRTRELKDSDGNTYQPHGTPWDPPYQPGPTPLGVNTSIDESDPVYWAAGAGLKWVLEEEREEPNTERDILAHMFPKNGDPDQGVDYLADGSLNSEHIRFYDERLNIREMPTDLQYPDWNNWLPDIHPLDFDPDHLNSTVHEAYVELQSAEVDNWSRLLGRFATKAREGTHGGYVAGFGNPTGLSRNLHINSRLSGALWVNVKAWEQRHQKNMTAHTKDLYCGPNARDPLAQWCDGHAWPETGGMLFALAPHWNKTLGDKRNPETTPAAYGSYEMASYMSHAWYNLQMITNPGSDSRTMGGSAPVDWGYQHAFTGATIRETFFRRVLSALYQYQLYSNDYGVNGGGDCGGEHYRIYRRGWSAAASRFGWVLGASGHAIESYTSDSQISAEVKTKVIQAVLREWLHQFNRYEPSDHCRTSDESKRGNVFMAMSHDPDPNVGFVYDRRYSDWIQWILPTAQDHYPAVVPSMREDLNELARWGKTMWPNATNPTWDDLIR